MVDGASTLAAMFSGMMAAKRWTENRGENILDTGAPWYDTYETKDGKYVAIGSIEPKFYAELLERLGLAGETLPKQLDRAGWPVLRAKFAATFKSRTRDEWVAAFEGSDACFAPVLTFSEARADAHNVARGTFVDVAGLSQPGPAPRFSRTPGAIRGAPPERGQHGRAALADWGFSAQQIDGLAKLGAGFTD
jgi:alpha-methylacyl-CoA racemase